MAYDLTNQRFGRLVVLRKSDDDIQKKSKNIIWHCLCDCSNEVDIRSTDLRYGKIKSCGCLHKEIVSTHGLPRDRLYKIWIDMKSRCNNKNVKSYHNYGGRGIKVCEEWNNYKNFYNWAIENGYKEDLTIDRVNVNGNYEPSNCKWATKLEQENNRRNNRYSTYNGKYITVSDFERATGIARTYITPRLNNKKTFDEIELEYKERMSKCKVPSEHSSISIAKSLNDKHCDILTKIRRMLTKNEININCVYENMYITKYNAVYTYYEINEDIYENILKKIKERKIKNG